MSLKIGKCDASNDGIIGVHTQNGLEHRMTIKISSNVSARRTELREVVRYAGDVRKVPAPHEEDVYIDTSPHNNNTVYIDCALYTGYAMLLSASDGGTKGTHYALELSFAELHDLTKYYINLEAEDNNAAGTDTSDDACSNYEKVVYTPTGSDVLVLDTAALGLSAGEYSFYLRCRSLTTYTAQFKGVTPTDTGSYNSNTAEDEWQIIDLGTFTIAATTDDFKVYVKDGTNTNNVEIDYMLIRYEDTPSRKYGVWDTAVWGD